MKHIGPSFAQALTPEKLIDNPNSSRVSNAEMQELSMILSATLRTLFSADAEGHFGFYYFMRKSGSLRA